MLIADPTSTEAVASPLAFTETPMSPSPTLTHTLIENTHKEVVDRSPTFAVLTVVLALFASVFVTIRDWKRLGGKR